METLDTSIPTEIVPGVWLGDMKTATDQAFFVQNKIGSVLNCTPDVPFYFKDSGVKYYRIAVDDNLEKDQKLLMMHLLPFAVKWLYYQHDDRKGPQNNIFVHCHMGIQRSAAAIVAYLFHTRKKDLRFCIEYVIQKRPVAFNGGNNINFLEPLAAVCSPQKSSATLKKKVLVMGDSHAKIFIRCNLYTDQFAFDVSIVEGATAQGCLNPNSVTNALNIFIDTLKVLTTATKYDYIMIMLGEVDCGYLMWCRKDKYGTSLEEQVGKNTKNIFDFVGNYVRIYFQPEQIIITGSVLPTIKDNTDKRYLLGQRSSVNSSQLERTELTLKYNEKLKKMACDCGYNYEDITEEILDKSTGIIGENFMNEDQYDHHLNHNTTYKLWLKKLEKY